MAGWPRLLGAWLLLPIRLLAAVAKAAVCSLLPARGRRRRDLAGDSVLITGGGRGIGRHLAREFARRGARKVSAGAPPGSRARSGGGGGDRARAGLTSLVSEGERE